MSDTTVMEPMPQHMMPAHVSDMPATFPRVVVIGAGISGILTGIKLRQRGIYSFTLLEKAGSLGGTWRDNTYPGVACDDPAHVYVYSFEPNPDWSHRFASGADILDYYQRTASKYGVTPHIRYNMRVTALHWTGDHWDITTGDGESLEADIVISAVGRLHHLAIPNIPGLDTFQGPLFHTARWRHDVSIENKRVAVVGTGSSATQITAALAQTASKLLLFQRTPQWVMTVPNDPVPAWLRMILRHVPRAGRLYYRYLNRRTAKATKILTEGDRSDYNNRAQQSLDAVRDPELKAKLTPNYAPGCKRMVNSPSFYDAVQTPNVELIPHGVDRVEPSGVITAEGRRHEVDVLVLATGFKTHAFMRPMTMTGQDGTTLDEVWRDGFVTYRSVALPSMPNFFMINGPYTPGSSGSVVPILEIDVAYVMQLVEKIRADRVALAPSAEQSTRWVDRIRARASKTVWVTGGCDSYYLDEHGVPVNNPATRDQFARDLHTPRYEDFEVTPLTRARRTSDTAQHRHSSAQ